MTQLDASAVEIIKDLAFKVHEVFEGPDGRKYVVHDRQYSLEELQPRELPLSSFISQKVTLLDRASFIDYIKLFQSPSTRVFLEQPANTFKAVFDYHKAASDTGSSTPDRAEHIATYACPLSDEWAAWSRIDSKEIAQKDFAEFIEERAATGAFGRRNERLGNAVVYVLSAAWFWLGKS
jgi:uncharacterized protein YfdQ (DUF2303 family)